MPQFEVNAARIDRADGGKTKFEMGREPLHFKAITGPFQISQDVLPIELYEMWQHETFMESGAPMDQLLCVRRSPEVRDQSTDDQLLRKAHSRMGRHLESTQLY